jgi:AcrR family transcriptional regulator
VKADQRKIQIMQTALRLFAGQGYNATTISDIIAEMGVARGTFYRYFRDKQDLFEQLLDTNFRYIKRVLPSLSGKGPTSASELETILTATFLQLMSQPDSRAFMNMMVNLSGGADPYFSQKIEEFYHELARVFAAYIRRIQDEGVIARRDPLALSYLIQGALREVFIQWARGGKFNDLKSLMHEAASFIVYGARAADDDEAGLLV